jgi:hypothetical protein
VAISITVAFSFAATTSTDITSKAFISIKQVNSIAIKGD